MGVSMGPGLTALTRILRSFNSDVQVRAKERTAAFVAEYTPKAAVPVVFATDELRMIAPPSTISGQRLLHGEQQALHIDVEKLVEMRLGDSVERGEFGYSGIGEQDVDPAEFLFDLGVEPVEIGEFRHVALNPQSPMADLRDGGFEFSFAAAGNDHPRSFGGEKLCRGETNAAIAARHDRDFSG